MRIVASFTPSLGTLRVWRNDVVKLFHAETFWACGFVPCPLSLVLVPMLQ